MKKTIILSLMLWLMGAGAFAMATQAQNPPEALKIQGPENAAQLSHQQLEEGKLLITVTDADENPIKGLTRDHFKILRGHKTAKILAVEPLATSKEVPLNIVMVVDNSKSMEQRNAVTPLIEALNAFYRTVRPIDTVSIVVFDEKGSMTVNGHSLHAKTLQTSSAEQLSRFVSDSMYRGLTEGTYLYDAMLLALDIAGKMPAKNNKFLAVFSDGEDINSVVKKPDLQNAAKDIANFSVFAVDYMPAPEINPFLNSFAVDHHGRAWKAASAAELLPVFESFSSTLLHRYVVAYRFLEPPSGTMRFADPKLTIEEVTTIDSAPLLNHIYFGEAQSELGHPYHLFQNKNETAAFDEKNFKGAMEKYRHVLNIIGRRLVANPDASVRLVGCNANTGIEKARIDMSRARAEAVRAYLRYVWGIDGKRMKVEQRNLPQMPSTSRIPEGQAENRRVEILSDHPAILDTVDSAYVEKACDLTDLRILPQIRAEAGIRDWQATLMCGDSDKEIKAITGEGDLPAEWRMPLDAALLDQIAGCDTLQTRLHITDREANVYDSQETTMLPVTFVQRTKQMTETLGYKVKEQYALILFDYDSDAIKARNKTIVDRIITRMQQIPQASVTITGHTDSIGAEAYNLKLSERRAQAVRKTIVSASSGMAERLHVMGVGPSNPLYDNARSEGRSLNRTVTITLEYLQK
jgi:outer membrane protein OmpA-like peptidoglycan-associated protein/Mg-chelatase subunit ChlD